MRVSKKYVSAHYAFANCVLHGLGASVSDKIDTGETAFFPSCVFLIYSSIFLAGTHGTGESTISALVGRLWWKGR